MKTALTGGVKNVAAALALTVGLAGVAGAQPGGFRGPDGPHGPMGGGPLGGLLGLRPNLPLHALNLTDAQQEQVRTILQSHREEGQALAKKAQTALQALRNASEGTVDEGAIAQQGQALGTVIGEAAVLRARVRNEVFAILTPEQQAEAKKIESERQARFQERREKLQQRRQQRQQGQRGQPGQQG